MTATDKFLRAFIGMATMLALSIAAQPALAKGAPTKMMNDLLVDHAGMTLYTFDKDPIYAGKSVCNGKCAQNWPPLMAKRTDMASGDYSIITRNDGSKQWAYEGKPLYTWKKDMKPGDMTGNNFKDEWHVVR